MSATPAYHPIFLSGGGEMGATMRAQDWSASPLGDPAHWPVPLRTSIGIMLNSRHPMYVAWGPDLALFHNDGFIPILGGRHPARPGVPMAELWAEVWDDIKDLIARVRAGESVWREDFPVVMTRNGHPEDGWFTFSWSPIHDDAGHVGGLLCVCTETTREVKDRNRVAVQLDLAGRLRHLFDNAPSFMAVLREPGHVYELANAAYRQLVGDRGIIGKPVREALPELVSQGFIDLLDQVFTTGKPYIGRAVRVMLRRGPDDAEEERFVDFVFQPIRGPDGGTGGIFIDGSDVTDLVRARERSACLVELGDRLRDLHDTGEIAQAAAELLGRTLGIRRAGYGRVDPSGQYVTVERDWADGTVPNIAGVHRLRNYGTFAENLHRGEILVIPDITADPRTADAIEALSGIGVAALINVPVIEDGRLSSILYIHDDEPRAWSPREVDLIRDVADRTWAAAERARSESSLRRLNRTLEEQVAERTRDRDRMWRLSTDVMLVARFDGTIVALNPAWATLLGWTEDELIGTSFLDLVHQEDVAATNSEAARLNKGLVTLRFENRYRHKDGSYRWLSWAAVPDETFIHAVGRDITAEREALDALRAAEEALRHAQKMEAVGQLTGGVAHDFNNLLQAILGNLDMLKDKLAGREDLLRHVNFASQAGDRAAILTQRLLAFARRQPLAPTSLNLNALVGGMQELLQRSVGEAIQVEAILAGGLWRTWADANQVENGLLNLAINARDAMPSGGKLTIETANSHLDDSYVSGQLGLDPGQYVLLSVTDTGSGMPHDVLSRAFEPFYTTKPIGQGTGLGLSQLYGFARQSGGHVAIYSEEGHGTTVKLYLPRHRSAAEAADIAAAPPEPATANEGETILVVEDEGLVRMLMVQALEDKGYRVIEAHEAQGALRILESDMKVDLLATDVGLPGMNGRQLAETARALRPDLSVLFLTGYAHNAALGDEPLGPRTHLISKPFAVKTLLTKIRTMLEEAAQ